MTHCAANGGCPMKGGGNPAPQPASQPVDSASGCPMKGGSSASEKYINPKQYNVYSKVIDPTNQMPATANQQKAEGQTKDLSVHRVQSSISKGGTDSTWIYPSPQMFWNALVRKGKTEGAAEDDMDAIISIHNNMNEATWEQILFWEKFHPKDGLGKEPKLLRFQGKPSTLSPKAQLKVLFGHPEPFDRHDWIVDRGGDEVRYIIDYYHDESGVQHDQLPSHLKDMKAMKSIKVDVRPALDSFEAVVDRVIRIPFLELTNKIDKSKYSPLPFFPAGDMLHAEKNKVDRIKKNWTVIKSTCEQNKISLANCSSDSECIQANIALQKCMASVVCPSIVEDFNRVSNARAVDDAQLGQAYNRIVKCIDLFEMDTKAAMGKTE